MLPLAPQNSSISPAAAGHSTSSSAALLSDARTRPNRSRRFMRRPLPGSGCPPLCRPRGPSHRRIGANPGVPRMFPSAPAPGRNGRPSIRCVPIHAGPSASGSAHAPMHGGHRPSMALPARLSMRRPSALHALVPRRRSQFRPPLTGGFDRLGGGCPPPTSSTSTPYPVLDAPVSTDAGQCTVALVDLTAEQVGEAVLRGDPAPPPATNRPAARPRTST